MIFFPFEFKTTHHPIVRYLFLLQRRSNPHPSKTTAASSHHPPTRSRKVKVGRVDIVIGVVGTVVVVTVVVTNGVEAGDVPKHSLRRGDRRNAAANHHAEGVDAAQALEGLVGDLRAAVHAEGVDAAQALERQSRLVGDLRAAVLVEGTWMPLSP